MTKSTPTYELLTDTEKLEIANAIIESFKVSIIMFARNGTKEQLSLSLADISKKTKYPEITAAYVKTHLDHLSNYL